MSNLKLNYGLFHVIYDTSYCLNSLLLDCCLELLGTVRCFINLDLRNPTYGAQFIMLSLTKKKSLYLVMPNPKQIIIKSFYERKIEKGKVKTIKQQSII